MVWGVGMSRCRSGREVEKRIVRWRGGEEREACRWGVVMAALLLVVDCSMGRM